MNSNFLSVSCTLTPFSDADDDAAADTAWFDPKATPEDAVFTRYFGKSSTGSYSLKDASHYRVISQPVEAQ